MYWKLAYEKTRFLNYRDGKIRAKCSPLSRLRKNSSIHWTVTWFWSCAVACLTVVAHTQARSIQPKFPEISVQNSMDQFGPTGKVSKKLVQLLRWNYGWIVVEWIAPVVRSRRILNSLLTTQLTTDWLPRAGFQPFLREFDGTDNLFPFLCLARVFIGWIAV